MEGFEQFLTDHVWSLVHWPFMAAAAVFMTIGQVSKNVWWTKERARTPGRWRWVWYWGRVTLPLHPVAVGGALGVLWRYPEPQVEWPASVFYFAFAGAVSVWLYQLIKALAHRQGLDLDPLAPPSVRPAPLPSVSDNLKAQIIKRPNEYVVTVPRPERRTTPYRKRVQDDDDDDD